LWTQAQGVECPTDLAPRFIHPVCHEPRNKVFGFGVPAARLDDMLRIMAAAVFMHHPGHEIPYLLNQIATEVGAHFNTQILKARIADRLAKGSFRACPSGTSSEAVHKIAVGNPNWADTL
jgi:hypothetical protein